jgi:hypothetical protein
MKKFILASILLLAGCSDAAKAQWGAIGDPAEVTCFAADGKVFYHGFSTGKVSTEDHSDGWYFMEKGTNDLVRVSGSCLVRNATH